MSLALSNFSVSPPLFFSKSIFLRIAIAVLVLRNISRSARIAKSLVMAEKYSKSIVKAEADPETEEEF